MLTPEEIEQREFLVSLRGYDRDEVHAFLTQLAEQMRELRAQVNAGAPASAEAPAQPAAADTSAADTSAMFAEIARETQRILEAAQEAGTEMKRKARQDADRELQAARSEAAKLIAEGERRREAIEQVVASLDEARSAVSNDLRQVGRTLEAVLRDLAPPATASSMREAVANEVLTDERSAGEGEQERPEEGAHQPSGEQANGAEGGTTEPEPGSREDATPEASIAPGEPPPDAVGASGEVIAGAAVVTVTAADEAPGDAPEALETAAAGAQQPLMLRTQALEAIEPQLARRIKRGVQDVQNVVLDRMRRADGKGEAEDFLPGDQELQEVGAAAWELLEQAYDAGVRSASVLAGRDLPTPDGEPDLVDAFLDDAGHRLRGSLAASLRIGLQANEPLPLLTDRVSAVFGELKGFVADDLAAAHLVRAYEQGLLDAWAAGDVEGRRWVLGREARCPEGRCRQNDEDAVVALVESFPSGHRTPPVHSGCTCTTLPA